MSCNIESFAYPAWWVGATTVDIYYRVAGSGAHSVVARSAVEMLPQGVSIDTGTRLFFPWSSIDQIVKDT